jgi:hypothetical protein
MCAESSSHFIVRAILELAADFSAEEMLLMVLPVVDEGAQALREIRNKPRSIRV